MSYQYGIQSMQNADGHQESRVQMRKSYTREYKLEAVCFYYQNNTSKRFLRNTIHLWIHDNCESHSLWKEWSLRVANVPRATHAWCGFTIISLFGAYPLLGACLLTTYAHKRICFLTRVYGICIAVWEVWERELCLHSIPVATTYSPLQTDQYYTFLYFYCEIWLLDKCVFSMIPHFWCRHFIYGSPG